MARQERGEIADFRPQAVRSTPLRAARTVGQQRESEGLLPSKEARDSAQRGLRSHLADYITDLRVLGRSADHIRNVEKRLLRLIRECGWERCADVTADSFQTWRAKQTKASKTLNEYQAAVSAFFAWLEAKQRVTTNPMEHVDKVPTRGRETVRRRALTNDEVRRLLAVSGRRRVVYLAAVTTGLRRGELAAIEKGDLHLSGQKPYLKARASTTKNRKEAVIWLGEELAQELRRIVPADAHEDARVFESIPTMKEMRADLKAAGIPLLDERGYRVDFHALRHTYGTNLRLAGVDPGLVQGWGRLFGLRI